MPQLATIICIAFMLYLFWIDLKKNDSPSQALWIPLSWMFLAGSRSVSAWLNLSAPLASVDAYAEGSPVDRAVFFSLIAAGAFVLSRRKIDWGQLLRQNPWIALYFLYCLSSMAWADDPFILCKRWIKDLGNPIMALVILTEHRPYEATGVLLRRLAFLLLPLSALFVKYYPDLGRAYHQSVAMYTGVSQQKNGLGALCLISGISLFWKLYQHRKGSVQWGEKANRLDYVLIGMLSWLLYMSNSQTSFTCLVVTVSLLVASRTTFITQRPSRILVVMIWSGLLFATLEETLHVKELVFSLLGRDVTLTSRTDVWEVVTELEVNSLVGAGFMSFWAGDRMQKIWSVLGEGIVQAHSGYVEQYLNMGYIGIAGIGAIVLSGLRKIRKHLDVDPSGAMLRLCFIVTAMLYNYTEAAFYGINNVWVLLLLGTIDVSGQRGTQRTEMSRTSKSGKPLFNAVTALHTHKASRKATLQDRTPGAQPLSGAMHGADSGASRVC